MTFSDKDRALIARLVKPYTAMHAMVVNHPKEIAALLSAARDEGRAEGLGGWEPIETAPRDGEELLVWGMSIGRRVASAKDIPRHEPYEWPGGWDFPTGATHWRPFPAPPASQTQEG